MVCQRSEADKGPRVKEVCKGAFTINFKEGKEKGGHQESKGQGKVKLEVPVGSANYWN